MRLLAPAHEQIHNQAPHITVITAGLAPTGTSESSVNDRDFLWQMYDAGLASLDNTAIGSHPFGWGNAPDVMCCNLQDERGWDDRPHFFFFNTLNSYHNILKNYSDNGKDVWVTEFGWPSWSDFGAQPVEDWMNYITPNQQGAYILRAFEIGHSMDFVGPMILWNMNFADGTSVGSRNEMAGFSLLYRNEDNNYSPRLAYLSLRDR